MKLLPKKKFKFTIKDSYLETILPRFREERISAFLTLSATLLSICIFGFFAINPTLVTIAQLRKQLSDSKYVDEKLVEKIRNLSNLQQSYAQLQDNIPVILTAVPSDPELPLILGQIQAMAETTQVQLSSIQTLPVEISSDVPTDGYLSFIFIINAHGTIHAINTFLSLLQSSDRLITTEGFTISKDPQTQDVLQLSFKGKAFFKKM